MNDLPETIDQLVKRVDALNGRVDTLEGRIEELEHSTAPRRPHAATEARIPPGTLESAVLENNVLAQPGSMFSVMGKAMLGIAGAYLLRAAAEASIAPRPLVAILGIAYAIAWLFIAARTPAEARLARAVYAANSAVILAPMLWELAIRFKVLPAPAIAAALTAYELTAFFLAGKSQREIVLQVGNLAVAALGVTLAIATHETLPFLAVLILAAALSEYRSTKGMGHSARMIVALAADAVVWLLIYIYSSPQSAIYSSPQNTRGDYPALGMAALLAPGALLFLLYASTATLKAVFKGLTITVFESAQTMIAFLLAAVALIEFGPASSKVILGVICLALAAGCYAGTLMLLSRSASRRNAAVFSTWSALLLLSGSFFSLKEPWAAAWLCVAAPTAMVAGARLKRVILEFHGSVFLFAAAIASGFAEYLGHSLIGAPMGAPGGMIISATASAALCYWAAGRNRSDAWERQALHLLLAGITALGLTALLMQGLIGMVALGMVPAAHHLAFIRTLTLCAVSMALVFGGARLRRPELSRLGYTGVALVAVKLIAEDLRHGHLEYIAASIFLFALTLIAAPRLARVSQKAEDANRKLSAT
ncbi:MAG: hypothetical protein WAL75_15070 [Terracidiphilus sp.]